jgi:hypothetical protein
MKIALTETFLNDVTSLQPGLQRKCWEMLSSLHRIEIKSLREQVLPGWRLHRLQSSPFISLSLDMNYRVLGKVDNEVLYIHRAIKHDLADASRVNRNDHLETPYTIGEMEIKPSDIFDVLVSLGLNLEIIQPFKGIDNEDTLIETLSTVDDRLATLVLALYESSGLIIPRVKYILLQNDKDFEKVLSKNQLEWNIYLHPSQNFIVTLPVDYRLAVSGSAGTGKTVCAWYRFKYLVQQGNVVGFVCPNKSILNVSKKRLEDLLKNNPVDCYFLIPTSSQQLIQLVAEVNHIIIDEAQELSPNWYHDLGKFVANKSVGITIFYDLNQLGGQIESGDTNRYKDRVERWGACLKTISRCNLMDLYINYRNSKEIAIFYNHILEESLPEPIRFEIPVFESGDVVIHSLKNISELPTLLIYVIKKLGIDFKDNEIGIVCVDNNVKIINLCQSLNRFGISISTDLEYDNGILLTTPKIIRGHERKAIVVCMPSSEETIRKWGKAINSYIALSRARDRLVVIETTGV